jgi:hypothetical protein
VPQPPAVRSHTQTLSQSARVLSRAHGIQSTLTGSVQSLPTSKLFVALDSLSSPHPPRETPVPLKPSPEVLVQTHPIDYLRFCVVSPTTPPPLTGADLTFYERYFADSVVNSLLHALLAIGGTFGGFTTRHYIKESPLLFHLLYPDLPNIHHIPRAR